MRKFCQDFNEIFENIPVFFKKADVLQNVYCIFEKKWHRQPCIIENLLTHIKSILNQYCLILNYINETSWGGGGKKKIAKI